MQDQLTVMTKFLMLGMPLLEVIRASTIGAAETVGYAEHVGTLGLGREADIAVLELVQCDCMLEDVAGQLRHCSERLVPRAVWRAGLAHGVTQEPIFPNPEAQVSACTACQAAALPRPYHSGD